MNPAEIITHAAFELQPFATRALKECADGFFNNPFMYCRTLTSVSCNCYNLQKSEFFFQHE